MSAQGIQMQPSVTLLLDLAPEGGLRRIAKFAGGVLKDLGMPVTNGAQHGRNALLLETSAPQILLTLGDQPYDGDRIDICQRPDFAATGDMTALARLESHCATLGIAVRDPRYGNNPEKAKQSLALAHRLARGLVQPLDAALILWEPSSVIFTSEEFLGLRRAPGEVRSVKTRVMETRTVTPSLASATQALRNAPFGDAASAGGTSSPSPAGYSEAAAAAFRAATEEYEAESQESRRLAEAAQAAAAAAAAPVAERIDLAAIRKLVSESTSTAPSAAAASPDRAPAPQPVPQPTAAVLPMVGTSALAVAAAPAARRLAGADVAQTAFAQTALAQTALAEQPVRMQPAEDPAPEDLQLSVRAEPAPAMPCPVAAPGASAPRPGLLRRTRSRPDMSAALSGADEAPAAEEAEAVTGSTPEAVPQTARPSRPQAASRKSVRPERPPAAAAGKARPNLPQTISPASLRAADPAPADPAAEVAKSGSRVPFRLPSFGGLSLAGLKLPRLGFGGKVRAEPGVQAGGTGPTPPAAVQSRAAPGQAKASDLEMPEPLPLRGKGRKGPPADLAQPDTSGTLVLGPELAASSAAPVVAAHSSAPGTPLPTRPEPRRADSPRPPSGAAPRPQSASILSRLLGRPLAGLKLPRLPMPRLAVAGLGLQGAARSDMAFAGAAVMGGGAAAPQPAGRAGARTASDAETQAPESARTGAAGFARGIWDRLDMPTGSVALHREVPVSRRIAVYVMTVTVLLMSFPVGMALLIYNILEGERMRVTVTATVLAALGTATGILPMIERFLGGLLH